ncbi:MAG: DNA primase [Promicromonosporaceae bacterium]|nr:DNA primase [Promicromonosporaceae bacterium]
MPGLILRESVDAVRDATRLDDVVGTSVTLVPAGGGALKGLCPFHDEKTPSFHVRPSLARYHCFGCGESGDAIDFVSQLQGLGFTEAVEYLARLSGIELKYAESSGFSGTKRPDNRELRSRAILANEAAAAFFRSQLLKPEAVAARKFLAERKFNRQAAELFEVGFAPASWDALTNHLSAQGFTTTELTGAGLAKPRNSGTGVYDFFRGRLMFPIRDTAGTLVGFGGRRLDELEEQPDKVAKYLNTPETVLYKKSQVLFGIDKARNPIRTQKQVAVVEGYTDVMAAQLSGVEAAVATCGTAFGSEHAKLIRRLMGDHVAGGGLTLAEGTTLGGEVIFTFDGDRAGQEAALKAFGEDQRFHAQTFVAVEPSGLDPCDLWVKSGPEAVRQLIKNREPLFKFVIKSKLRQFDLETVEGRVEAIRATAPVVAQIRDAAYRSHYQKELAGLVGVDVASVSAAVSAALKDFRQSRRAPSGSGAVRRLPPYGFDALQSRDPSLAIQRYALAAVLQSPELVEPEFDTLPTDTFTHPALAWLHLVIQAAGGVTIAAAHGPKRWIKEVEEQANPILWPLLNSLAIAALPVGEGSQLRLYIDDVVANLRIEHLDRQIAAAKGRLSRAEANGSGYSEISAEIQELEAGKRALQSS